MSNTSSEAAFIQLISTKFAWCVKSCTGTPYRRELSQKSTAWLNFPV